MTVGEAYKGEIDLNHLNEISDVSDYWAVSLKFVEDVWEREVDEISNKQLTWLDKISEGLELETTRH